jgi:hypothetical protein
MVIDLPDLPDHWRTLEADIHFRITLLRYGSPPVQARSMPGERLSLTFAASLANGEYASVRAVPVLPGGVELSSAGALIPMHLRREGLLRDGLRRRLELSWERGPISRIVEQMIEAGMNPALFNVERLEREIEERLGERRWNLDTRRLLSAVAEGEFSANDIRPLEDLELDTPILEPGRWIPSIPTGSVRQPLELLSLPPGLSRWIRADDRAVLDLFFEDGKLISVLR